MTRLVADRGGSIQGMPAQDGNVRIAIARRSCTNCRASMMSVPGLKMRVIADTPGTDLERKVSRCGVLLSEFSSGTVISDSTSWVDIPGPSVWISTYGGANSGKTSTGMPKSCLVPMSIITAAAATIRKRKCRLDLTIQRNMAQDLLAQSLSNPELG